MKKVININLGGYPFTIDEDAFETLNRYLDRLESHFKGSVGFENIMQDIESRLAELMTEKMSGRTIISTSEVQYAINTMGQPEQLSEEDEDQRSDGTHRHRTDKRRRLYRDEENKVIAGVCSGLAAYFGVEDPIWVRLIFVASFLVAGFGFLPYIILWIVVPTAKTSSEKLSMQGEPVNINSISNKIQEDLSDLSRKISDLGQEFRKR
jgi:phage shock protein PspC (stress-responsive transcriptional regulator)